MGLKGVSGLSGLSGLTHSLPEPTLRTNLQFWIRAHGSLYPDGEIVPFVQELSGNNRNLIQATSSKRFQFVRSQIGGRDVFRADGVDDLMYADGSWVQSVFGGINTPFTSYTVFKPTAAAFKASWSVSSSSDGTPYFLQVHLTASLINYRRSDTGVQISFTSGGTFAVNTPVLVTQVYDGATMIVRRNGVEVHSVAHTTVAALTLNRFTLGALRNAGTTNYYFGGDIAENLLYSGSHTTQVADIEGPLLSYYGLS